MITTAQLQTNAKAAKATLPASKATSAQITSAIAAAVSSAGLTGVDAAEQAHQIMAQINSDTVPHNIGNNKTHGA